MLGDNLMALWFKPQDGYKVPEAKGRYVDMGMSFKKNEEKTKQALKRKPGELLELVFNHVTTKWRGTQDIAYEVDASRESVRCCLEKLTKLGRIQSFGEHKSKQYRRAKQ